MLLFLANTLAACLLLTCISSIEEPSNLAEFKLNTPNPGWHVASIRITNINNGTERISIALLADGITRINLLYRKKVGDAGSLRPCFAKIAEFVGSPLLNTEKWRAFNKHGSPLNSVDRMIQAGSIN